VPLNSDNIAPSSSSFSQLNHTLLGLWIRSHWYLARVVACPELVEG